LELIVVTALIVVVLVIGIAGGLFIKVASSYGGVKPFLAKELKSERETLAMHRKKVKALEKSAKGELSSATKDLKSAEKEYTKRVGAATSRLNALQNPGKGKKVAKVGKVTLFEHQIEFRGNAFDLAGLRISTNITPNAAMLTLLFDDGIKLVETYDTSWRDAGEGKQKRDYTHEEIIQFETVINNYIVTEEDFVRSLPGLIIEAESILADENENTHAIDSAAENLQRQEGGSQAVQDAKEAREELVIQEELYKSAVQQAFNGKA
jgi:hypothetical protein